IVTGWSYFVASNGVPASWNSCTRAFPREVTRSEACIGLPPDISGISGTVTGASHSPARVFMVVKDFCASDSTQRRDFMFHSPQEVHFLFALGPRLFAGVDPLKRTSIYC